MGRPRSVHPSAAALQKRAERAIIDFPEAAGLDDEDSASDSDALDSPPISSATKMEEAVRIRAVYDARKSRVAAEYAQLRLDTDRGRLLTKDQVEAYMARARELIITRISEFCGTVILEAIPEQQASVRHKLNGLVDGFRRSLAEQLKSLNKTA